MQYKLLFFLLLCLPPWALGQQRLKITGGHFKLGSTSMVLKDTKFTNNGAFDTGTGKVIVQGTASDANSCLGGSSFTEIHDLHIDKSSNNASLGGDVEILNQLNLLSGCLDVGNHDLSLEPGGGIVGAGPNRFIKFSGTGSIVIEVGNNPVTFPVGNTSYNPVILQNSGGLDNFILSLTDQLLSNGTSGPPITSGAVNRTWLIAEGSPGGSNLNITVQWNAGDELASFNRGCSYVSHYTGGAWDSPSAGPASGSGPYTHVRSGVTSLSPFAVFGLAPSVTWTGSGDGSNWSDAANWDTNALPAACQDVIIPTGQSIIVQAGTTANAKTLDVATGTQLTVESTAVLNVGI